MRGETMNVTVAIDSLKGSLSSMEAGAAIAEGIHRVDPEIQVCVRPLADGGEGTVDALTAGMNGKIQTITVTGPAGKPVECEYGIIQDTKTAIVEMAGAAGITQVSGAERNPMHTTTYGVGEVIKDAIQKGCRRFIVGIGGSATNDCGIGMLQALGYGILNEAGEQVSFGARGVSEVKKITTDEVIPELKNCSFHIACDVTNPLCGPKGCSAIYGPQKGADEEMIQKMDQWLHTYGALVKESIPHADAETPGAGAAGGLGFAFLAFMNGKLESGIDIVLEETRLEECVKDADYVVTGEGRLDGQTVMGKAPIGVAKIAKKYNIPVIGFSGCVTKDAIACNEAGIDAFFPILRTVITLEEAMDSEMARENMIDTVEQVFRLIQLGDKN